MKKSLLLILAVLISLTSLSMAVEWKGRIGLGLRGPLYAPMVTGDQYEGRNTNEPFMMGLGGDLEFKYGLAKNWVVGLSVGYWSTYDDSLSGDAQSFKLNNSDNASTKLAVIPLSITGQYYFIPESNVQPYLLIGLNMDMSKYTSQVNDNEYSSTDLYGKLGVGINFWLGESVTLDISGRYNYLLANMSNDFPDDTTGMPISLVHTDMSDAGTRPFLAVFEPSIGLTYYLGGAKDTDKDGIKDKFDQCPDTPKGALVDEFGCPLDSDGDGVFDGIDLCPETPQKAIVDIVGCPLDSDEDGVPDGIDLCQDTPLGIEVDIYGCPLDSDKDGIPDFKDQQLDTPLGATVDENGIAIDTDLDGVPDGIDKCPDTGAGDAVDEYGCPMAKPVTEMVRLNIKYASGSAEPDAESKVVLDDIAARLKVYRNVNIQINGFTDDMGSARSNLKLSQQRAEAVMNYLLEKGIGAERMTARGYGEDENFFIDTNNTPEGRQVNRRVEIVPVK